MIPFIDDAPVGFDNPPTVNLFHAVLLLGGVPLVLFVVITIAVYLPAVVRGERVAPGQSPMQDQWLGGPAAAPAELPAGRGRGTPAITSGATEPVDTRTGGASGRW